MTAVILAAGKSSRLLPLTTEIPKCLLMVGQQTMLEWTVNSLLRNRLTSIILVVGFQREKIVAFVRSRWPEEPIRFAENPDFAETNNAYSLLLARDAVASDSMLLLDGDILFDDMILRQILLTPDDVCCVMRTQGTFSIEDIKIELNDSLRIRRIGKDIPLECAAGESIGMEKFSAASAQLLFQALAKRVISEKRVHEFYEASFQEMIDTGLEFHAMDAGHLSCIEVDTEEDLINAREMFAHRD
jgi:choline kinase